MEDYAGESNDGHIETVIGGSGVDYGNFEEGKNRIPEPGVLRLRARVDHKP